jgi:drug/metabolite transporter (DMT)-like permease
MIGAKMIDESRIDEGTNERVHPVLWLFLTLSLICQVTAAVFGKVAALRMGHPSLAGFVENPWYLGTLACLILQAFFWQLVLRGVRLFVAYLFTSLNYLLILAASRIFFLERVTPMNLIGAAVIVTGVYIVVREDLP